MSAQFPKGWTGTGLFAVLILCHYSTGCDEMCDYFAIEAGTMIDIVRVNDRFSEGDLNKACF